MHPTIAAWADALRSGQYRRTTHRLRKGNRLDPLGVLCHLVDPTRWNKRGVYGWHFGAEDHYVPADIAGPIGLSRSFQDHVTELNDLDASDNGDLVFGRVAAAIERHYS